jgi:hypothetical protein
MSLHTPSLFEQRSVDRYLIRLLRLRGGNARSFALADLRHVIVEEVTRCRQHLR